jgi:hypothetical protein
MNEKKANEYLGRSRCYLSDLRRNGRIHPPYIMKGRMYSYSKEDLDAWKEGFVLKKAHACILTKTSIIYHFESIKG